MPEFDHVEEFCCLMDQKSVIHISMRTRLRKLTFPKAFILCNFRETRATMPPPGVVVPTLSNGTQPKTINPPTTASSSSSYGFFNAVPAHGGTRAPSNYPNTSVTYSSIIYFNPLCLATSSISTTSYFTTGKKNVTTANRVFQSK